MVQRLQPVDVVQLPIFRLVHDGPGLRVGREQRRAGEAVANGEHLGEHRQVLRAAVFSVEDEDDVLALARPLRPFVPDAAAPARAAVAAARTSIGGGNEEHAAVN